ncbi:hypothetical protein FKM82_028478 [Ascaphus truei]
MFRPLQKSWADRVEDQEQQEVEQQETEEPSTHEAPDTEATRNAQEAFSQNISRREVEHPYECCYRYNSYPKDRWQKGKKL